MKTKLFVLYFLVAIADVFAEAPLSDAEHVASVSWRLSQSNWVPDGAFANTVSFFTRHRLTGKVAFFTCDQHSPVKLERLLELMPVLSRRIAALKALGYEVGINHLCTIGQTEEGYRYAEWMEGAEFFTASSGKKSPSNRCPNDAVWRERYVKPIYEALARTNPDFIWIDDDLRMENHGPAVGPACFCPNCMRRIRERLGYTGGLDGLESFLTEPEKGLERRRAMLQLTRDTLGELTAYVRGVVRSVSPTIELGGMDGPGTWNGWGYEEKIAALAAPGETSFWRPGSGFYDDVTPGEMLLKANDIGQAAALLPDRVTKIESELECFNYQRLAKGVKIVESEALAYIAAGSSGTAWNVLADPVNDDLETFGPLVDRLQSLRPLMDEMVCAAGRWRPRGVWDCRTRDVRAGHVPGQKWLESHGEMSFLGSDLQRIGLPAAYREEEAEVFAPTAEAVLEMSEDRLDRLLSRGVYVSPESLRAFALRGRSAEVGFEPAETLTGDTFREKLVAHPLNEGFVGRERDARLSFWPGEVTVLRPLPGATVAAKCVDVGGGERAACVAGTFENARGGRIYVSGFFPYTRQLYKPAALRMHRVFDWLSYGRLTGVVDTYCRAAMWVRGDLASVLNLSFDVIDGPEILLRGEKWAHGLRVLGDAAKVILPAREGDRYRYKLPNVPAWSVMALQAIPPRAADAKDVSERGAWFKDARFGLFLHWGIYSCAGKGEWSYATDKWEPGTYEAMARTFNPTEYRPREWAKLAKAAGMKYAVLTSRHHDGFCMFDSHFTDYKITNTPYGKDAVREFLEAFRAEGMRVGLYYSLPDWAHPGYADPESPECIAGGKAKPHVPTPEQYASFTNLVYSHVNQLTTEYGKLDLLFLDYTSRAKAGTDYFGRDGLLDMIYRNQPDILVNDRLSYAKDGFRDYDYYTPELCVPTRPQTVKGRPVLWETCATMNDHWGYAAEDKNYKSAESIVAGLVGCVSRDGNLLLNVGPDALGQFPEESVDRLRALSRWFSLHRESITGCGKSEFAPPFGCAYTQRGRMVYCHVIQPPIGHLVLPGLRDRVRRATLLRTGEPVKLENVWGYELLARDEQRLVASGLQAGDVIRMEVE